MTVNLKKAKLLMFLVNKITDPIGAKIVIISDGKNYLVSQKALYQAMRNPERVKNMLKSRRYDPNEMILNKLEVKKDYPDIYPAFSKRDSRLRFITCNNAMYILRKSEDENAGAYMEKLCCETVTRAIVGKKPKRDEPKQPHYSDHNKLHGLKAQLDSKYARIQKLEVELDKRYHDIDRAKMDISRYKKENENLKQENEQLTNKNTALEEKIGIYGQPRMTRSQHLKAFLFGD